MRRIRYFIVLVVSAFVFGCGGSSSSGGGGGTSTATLTGTLGTGTAADIGIKAAAAASGYAVVVVDNASNKTYRTTTNADGTFSVDVPTGSNYLLSIVNNGDYVGPTVFQGTSSEVNTAITPTANANLGSITIDATNGYARTATAPDSVNTSVTAVAANGKPVGAGNDGKTRNSGITNRTDSDEDKDGIPNLFDADEDNDGVRNGIASTPSGATVVSSVIETVYMSSNIWANHGEDLPAGSQPADVAPNLISMWLNVVPKSGQESKISSVQCIDVPAVIKNVATVRFSSSIGDPSGYPAENSLWKDSSYNLYKTTTLAREQWIISLKPAATMSVGDTFTIRV